MELAVTFQRQVDPNDPNNQLLEDEEDDNVLQMGDLHNDDLQVEKEFLASLTEEQRTMLIKHFTRDTDKKHKKKHKKKKKEKKTKKKKKNDEASALE